MTLSKTAGALALLLALGVGAAGASAQTFDQTHPRRAEVNTRLATQNARIREGVASGALNHRQARRLHADDRAIRGEERAEASVNGGHVTRAEQRRINRQENRNSRAIYGEKHPG